MKMMQLKQFSAAKKWACGLIVFTVLTGHAGSNYKMSKYVISSGAEIKNGAYVMNSAIGQNVTAKSSSANYQLNAGFFQQNRDLIFTSQFED